MRIRALDRWSAVSLAMTVPSPVHGDPRLLDFIARLREIPGIDLVEARCGVMDAGQLDPFGEVPRDRRAQVALPVDAVTVAAQGLHANDARDLGEHLGNPVAACLDIDHIAAAQDLRREL